MKTTLLAITTIFLSFNALSRCNTQDMVEQACYEVADMTDRQSEDLSFCMNSVANMELSTSNMSMSLQFNAESDIKTYEFSFDSDCQITAIY